MLQFCFVEVHTLTALKTLELVDEVVVVGAFGTEQNALNSRGSSRQEFEQRMAHQPSIRICVIRRIQCLAKL